jgi:hypothetical protein
MDIYEISPSGQGWFHVTITTRDGRSWIKTHFVNEVAAQKWLARHHRTAIRSDGA